MVCGMFQEIDGDFFEFIKLKKIPEIFDEVTKGSFIYQLR